MLAVPKSCIWSIIKANFMQPTGIGDGTPAVDFVIKWVTKENASLTTQALTVYKDGYSVTVATHTWEVQLPDRSFFYTLKLQ